MRHFTTRELREAEAYAAQGGIAIHTHQIIVDRRKAPACFVREVEAGRDIAHMFGRDEAELIRAARGLGVRVILVERRGQPGQHIDLCGGPLRKALAMCERPEVIQDGQGSLF